MNIEAWKNSCNGESNSVLESDWNFKHVNYPEIEHGQSGNKEPLKKRERWAMFKIICSSNGLTRTTSWRKDNSERETVSKNFQKAKYPEIGIDKFECHM